MTDPRVGADQTTTTGHDMTEAGTITLAGFLLDRISETEAKVTDGAQGAAVSYDGWHTVDCGTGIGYWANGECTCRYVDRVLAECEAKRRIIDVAVEDLLPNTLFGEATDDYGWAILYALALPYADHPDYREEWRP